MVCLIPYICIYSIVKKNICGFRNLFLHFYHFYFRKNDGNLQLDDDYIMTTLKWAQNRILTLNDLVKEDLIFLWILPSSMPNVKQTECSGIIISLRTRDIDSHSSIATLYAIFSDAIKLLNAELIEIDASNYKTDWMTPYLKDFAKKNGVPFAALMKILRNVIGGVKVT